MIVCSIVLAGGASTRMGYPKCWLSFGPTTALAKLVNTLQDVTHPVIVVGAGEDQDLPPLPSEVTVVHDARRDRGPLEGIAAGMRAAGGMADVAFVTACDAPLLSGAFVGGMADLLGHHDAAVPWVDGRFEPLAGVYRLAVLPRIEEALRDAQLAVHEFLGRIDVRAVEVAELRAIDPGLRALTRMNTPEEYARALELAGLPPAQPGRRAPAG
jgi:molybdopterin-guanine dinucleotide biosynthesis protein A